MDQHLAKETVVPEASHCRAFVTRPLHYWKQPVPSIIFPNPAFSGTSIKIKNKTIETIEIFDLQQKLVFSKKTNTENHAEIPTDSLKKGIYFIKINNVEIQKLIIQ